MIGGALKRRNGIFSNHTDTQKQKGWLHKVRELKSQSDLGQLSPPSFQLSASKEDRPNAQMLISQRN